MHSTTHPSAIARFRASFGRRGVALLLALAVEALIVLLFLFYLVPEFLPEKRARPTMFGFDVDTGDDAEPAAAAEAETKARPRAGGEAAAPPPPEPIAEPPPELPESPLPANILWMSRRDYAAADIARAPSTAPGERSAAPGRAAGDSALVDGRGPNGEPLYAAEWHVRPTDAQLSAYIPARTRQDGWGLVACRTVANYRVEDCVELGDSPRGSGLAGAVRQAAWQFRVRPPRVGGRALVGAWVRIRIDYSVTPVE